MIPRKKGDWEIQCNHAFFSSERGWKLRKMYYPQRLGAKSKNKTHENTFHLMELTQKSYSCHLYDRELQAPIQRALALCPLLANLFPTKTKILFMEYS